MKLFHATHRGLLPAIRRDGLRAACATGRRKAVWGVQANKQSWAVIHVGLRHGWRLEDICIVEFDVPRSWMRKHVGSLWYIPRDVPPGRFRAFTNVATIAAY